jgi:chromodomain-helicase-DNA-binding protein 1
VGEVRFSTRQAAKVTNYNEEDDYGLSEEDQDVTPNNWVPEPTGPSVDTVLNHRLNEGAGMLMSPLSVEQDTDQYLDGENPTKKDYEYYVSCDP